MHVVKLSFGLALLATVFPGSLTLRAIELQPATLSAWNDYVRQADGRMQARLDGHVPFLWMDEVSGLRDRLRRGQIVVAPGPEGTSGKGIHPVPNGLIHDWIGAIFIPNATLEDLLAVVHDYSGYKEIYKPVVADSRLLACTDSGQEFSMIWQHKVLFVNAAIEGQYVARDFLEGRRGYDIADTTRVREIQGYGQTAEHFLPADEGNGFLWRLHSITRYQERDGGVYLEIEAMALTRDVPASLRWLVNPVINHLSINSLTTTLRQTRKAVQGLPEHPGVLTACRPTPVALPGGEE